MQLYRAVLRAGFQPDQIFKWRDGRRLPGNLPYLVDNLWEFTRPAGMPSRRSAVFASPTAALAVEGACAGKFKPEDFLALEVVFSKPPTKLMQLSVKDARYHPDAGVLQRLVNRLLDPEHGRWNGRSDESKVRLAPLFMPGTSAEALERACERDKELRAIVDEAAAAVTMWADAPDVMVGEISFELGREDTYTLRPFI